MEGRSWAEDEFREVELGDKRRTKRLIRLAEERSERPDSSIAVSCGGKAGAKAAYRFLDNEAIGAEAILEGHYQASGERAAKERIVLAVQDTTDLNYTDQTEMEGLGYLQGLKVRGVLVHSTLLVTPQRVPLGLIDQQVWMRPDEEFQVEREKRKVLPTETKESQKWLLSMEATAHIQKRVGGTQLINIGDSEADIFDLFRKAQELKQDLLVRACVDRLVDHAERLLRNYLLKQVVAGEIQLSVPRRAGQTTRKATVVIRFASVSIRPPKRRKAENLASVRLWAILAQEVNPPTGVKPIDWLLLTTVCVDSFDMAQTCLHWYSCRWVIEMYHKVLKSGCRVEERQFGDTENLQRYLALDAVVAWRVLYLTMFGRVEPDLPCTVILDMHEWQALYCFLHHTHLPPQRVPTLKEATLWIAQLGGFLGRKSDGSPGSISIWTGLQRLSDIADAWLAFRHA